MPNRTYGAYKSVAPYFDLARQPGATPVDWNG
jgi:hypothetical protein